jgi:sensor histidine kinase YesM
LFINPHRSGMLVDRKRFIKALLITVLFNTIIALFLTHLEYGEGFAVNFIFSQSIGLSICISVMASHLLFKDPTPLQHFFMILMAMILGTAFGSLLGVFLAGIPLSWAFHGKPVPLFQLLGLGLLFGSVITYFFFSQERISQARAEIQEERIRRLNSEKKVLETHLKLLQAQIEPHFLFNTLTTVLTLVDTDTEKAAHMLTDLIRFLRVSLSKTRAESTTLEDEMEMARAYLNIYKVRMGNRLQYHIRTDEGLREKVIPPMLLQPLVENAIRHGLEPAIKGGMLTIQAENKDHNLRITVADTGKGLDDSVDRGFGLKNIRDRLHSLFGPKGRLILEENRPHGLKATIEIPNG